MKHIIFISILGLAVGACATSEQTSAELPPLLVANQPGDGDLTCEQITTEINDMNTMISAANQSASDAETSGAVAGTAANAAVNTALYSGVLGRVPGLGVAANAAGGIAQQRAKAEAERQAENARRAELRRTALTGIAAGKGC